jgi:Fe-S cluster assembly iron-binding protein IscA
MLNVTETAKDLLQSIDHPAENVLRLEPGGAAGTLSLKLGAPEADDEVIERDGGAVLHVPPTVSTALDGATIDTVQTDSGPRLTISQ